jgi:hypothetical protein
MTTIDADDISSPFVSYDSISLNGTRLARVQSFKEFEADVAAHTLPQYAHLSPNILKDGYITSLEDAANWMETFLRPLLQNAYFMHNTLIFIAFDESATHTMPNNVMGLLLGDIIPEDWKDTSDPRFYSPYSILSTLESNWELPCLGRYDVGANVFEFLTYKTGYKNHMPSNMKTVSNNVSYSGFLNSDPALFRPIPPPNVRLVGAAGLGIEDRSNAIWGVQVNGPSPYEGTNRANDGGPVEANAVVYRKQAPAPPKYAVAPAIILETQPMQPTEPFSSTQVDNDAGSNWHKRLCGFMGDHIIWFTLGLLMLAAILIWACMWYNNRTKVVGPKYQRIDAEEGNLSVEMVETSTETDSDSEIRS